MRPARSPSSNFVTAINSVLAFLGYQYRDSRQSAVSWVPNPSTSEFGSHRNAEASIMIFLRDLIGWSAVALVAASAALAATPSFAVPRYDGLWSVSIVTKKGDCVASYRYPMRIAKGFLANGGAIALTVSGKVAPSGAVIVKVSSGTTSAIGSGRLAANAGSGYWRGASCSGSWTAERRSS